MGGQSKRARPREPGRLIVPRGIEIVHAFLRGGGAGAYGAIVECDLVVRAGQVLDLYVGQRPTGQTGGWPDGGRGGDAGTPDIFSGADPTWGQGGGGSSRIMSGGAILAIAGGAGGTAGYTDDTIGVLNQDGTDGQGGDPDGNVGTNGGSVNPFTDEVKEEARGGEGATQSTQGAGGENWTDEDLDGSLEAHYSSLDGEAGSFLQGGAGCDGVYDDVRSTPTAYAGGGGGGGGYYGGGGGAALWNINFDFSIGGSGGGGSSWAHPTYARNVEYSVAAVNSNGLITLTWG